MWGGICLSIDDSVCRRDFNTIGQSCYGADDGCLHRCRLWGQPGRLPQYLRIAYAFISFFHILPPKFVLASPICLPTLRQWVFIILVFSSILLLLYLFITSCNLLRSVKNIIE